MSKIDRYNGDVKAFASESLTNERTIFGEVTESDSLTDQISAAFLRGWAGTVGANDFPSVQDFSAAFFTSTQFISYLHQMGVAEWNENQEYPTTGATCVHDGFLWLRTDAWVLTDEPELTSDSWYLNHPIFQWAVSQLAGGDKSKVAFIKEGVTIGSYEWMIWPATGQVFDVNGASGTFGSDFNPATGTATGINDGPLINFTSEPQKTKYFSSSEQIMSSGGLVTVAHGLTDENGDPTSPRGCDFHLVCAVAANGYSVGDTLKVSLNGTSSDVSRVAALYFDDTNLYFRFSDESSLFLISNKSTGVNSGVIPSNYNLVLTGWY